METSISSAADLRCTSSITSSCRESLWRAGDIAFMGSPIPLRLDDKGQISGVQNNLLRHSHRHRNKRAYQDGVNQFELWSTTEYAAGWLPVLPRNALDFLGNAAHCQRSPCVLSWSRQVRTKLPIMWFDELRQSVTSAIPCCSSCWSTACT